MKKTYVFSAAVVTMAVLFGGCAKNCETDAEVLARLNSLEQQLDKKDTTPVKETKVLVRQKTNNIAYKAPVSNHGSGLVPQNAKPGECYAKVIVPATYKSVAKKVLVKEAEEKINVIPATYKWVDKKVVVQDASYKIITTPATYKWIDAKVQVEPAKEKIVNVPASYKTTKAKVLIKPAYTTWKKGRGEIEKVDNSTGEIMCLVEIPAVYETLTKQVLDKPAHTAKVQIPAKYKMIRKKVLVTPAVTKKIEIPAVYEKVRVKELVTQAKHDTIKTPAQYKIVHQKEVASPAHTRWQSILCETNTTPNVIKKLQAKLNQKGFDAGSVDGVYGWQTKQAVSKYQESQKMATGALTVKTLQSLGIL